MKPMIAGTDRAKYVAIGMLLVCAGFQALGQDATAGDATTAEMDEAIVNALNAGMSIDTSEGGIWSDGTTDDQEMDIYEMTINRMTDEELATRGTETMSVDVDPGTPFKLRAVPPRLGGIGTDTDDDGMPDVWEAANYLDQNDPADADLDPDGDGLTNLQEFQYGTDPNNQDTDNDGLTDGQEVLYTRVLAWGRNASGAVALAPRGPTNIVAVSAGDTFGLALLDTGRVIGWGSNIVVTGLPSTLTNVIAIAAGNAHAAAVRASGTVVCWGNNVYNRTTVPMGLGAATDVKCGIFNTMALLADGTVRVWGDATYTNVPASATGVVAIAAGTYHFAAVRRDGTVICWGMNSSGQTNVPATVTNIVAVDAGNSYTMALRGDGRVFCWGANTGGQTNVPGAVTNAFIFGAGLNHAVAVRTPHVALAWGTNSYGQLVVPAYMGVPLQMCGAARSDWSMILTTWTDPVKYDTDDDGLSDSEEAQQGTDPLNPDTDGDGMPDGWEVFYGFDPLNPSDAALDPDGDGLTNYQEYLHHTDPFRADTDGDGLPDGWEVKYGLNPNSGLPNDPVAWWKLDDDAADGWTADSSGNNYPGMNYAATPSVPGVLGNCFEFDGSSTAIVVPDPALKQRFPAGGSITIAAWVRPRSIKNFGAVMIAGMDVGRCINTRASLRLNETGVPYYQSRNGDSWLFSTLGPLETNRWYLLVGVQTGCVARLYVNGVEANISTNFGPLLDPWPYDTFGDNYSDEGMLAFAAGYAEGTGAVARAGMTATRTEAGLAATAIPTDSLGAAAPTSETMRAYAAGYALALMASDTVNQASMAVSTSRRTIAGMGRSSMLRAGSSPLSYDWGSYADLNVSATIGAWTDWCAAPESTFDGWIDDVRFYDRGLSESEVLAASDGAKTVPGGDGITYMQAYLEGRNPLVGTCSVANSVLALNVLTPLEQ